MARELHHPFAASMNGDAPMQTQLPWSLGHEVFLRRNPQVRGRIVGYEIRGTEQKSFITVVRVRRDTDGTVIEGFPGEFDADDT